MRTSFYSARWLSLAVLAIAGFVAGPFLDAANVLTDPNGVAGFDLYGNGLLWWRDDGQCTGEFVHDSTIRIRAANVMSGTKSLARDCTILPTEYDNAVRDDAYVYYFRNRQLYRKALSAAEADPGIVFGTPPHSPTLPTGQDGGYLEMADGRLWFGRYRADIDRIDIFSIKTDGSEGLQSVVSIPSAGAPIRKLKWFVQSGPSGTVDALAVLLANGKLYRHRMPGGIELLWVRTTDFSIHRRAVVSSPSTFIYATEGVVPGIGTLQAGTSAGHLYQINADNGQVAAIYTASNHNQILSVLTSGSSGAGGGPTRIFLTEGVVACSAQECNFSSIVITASPLGLGGSWGPIVFSGAGGNLRNDRDYLYYLTPNTIERISLDTPPIQFDLQGIGLEAGHTIQDLNASVNLPAGKENLYVRGYAFARTNTSGHSPFFPSARLRVRVNGEEVAGSPFSPVNNTSIDATDDLAVLRRALDRSFLFVLPALPAGSLTMTMTLNQNGTLPEADYGNNSVDLAQPIQLRDTISVCLRMYPMPTGAGTFNPNTPGFWDLITRAKSLLPASFLTTELQPPLGGMFFTEPFDFGDEDETQDAEALDKIECIREQSSSEGGSEFCRFRHWVGMIHPGITNFGGLGNVSGQCLIASMQGVGGGFPNPNQPVGGRILAHEMCHNYGREHVDCGGPEDPDPSYPFDPCTLGSSDPTAFWGLDLLSRRVINPTNTGDLMSYAGNRWPSSWTWQAIVNTYAALSAFGSGGGNLNPTDTPWFAPAASSPQVLFINGYILPRNMTAVFRTFYQLPGAAVDAGNLARNFAESIQAGDRPDPYVIRQVSAAGAELARTALPCDSVSDGRGRRLSFAHWIPYQPATRRVQLIQGATVLAERIVSGHRPLLQVQSPIIDLVRHTVRLAWTAFDPDGDALRFNVHYSADNGATWNLVANDATGLGLTLDPRTLPGSARARLRVTASDGVNSTAVITSPFVLPRNPPQPFVSGILEGQRLSFGWLAELFGAAIDPEQDSASVRLKWTLTGPTERTGTNATLALAGLSPGPYLATLLATDADGLTGQTTRHFEVLPLSVPDGATPNLDGYCRDRAYTNAAFVQMPLGNGQFATARLVHADSNLYLSFTDLQSVGFGTARRVGLRVDADASGEAGAQLSDRGFFVDATGIPAQEVGNGTSMTATLTPLPGFTAVVGVGSNTWSAELRIADHLLGGWNHAARIMLDHDALNWPALATDHQPATWAPVWFGVAPPPPTNRPPIAHAGADQIVDVAGPRSVVLDGSASLDPDNDGLTFQWIQVFGPSVVLSDATQAATRLVTPAVTNPVTLRFRLVVSDGWGSSSADEAEVTLWPTPQVNPMTRSRVSIHEGVLEARLLTTAPGQRFRIEATQDFRTWSTVHTNVADASGLVDFLADDPPIYRQRFYRAVSE